LGAEGADAEDVRDGVSVPTFGEHGDRDHAADGLAEAPLLATVFITSRRRLSSERFSACWRSPVRSTISRRKRSISPEAMLPEVVVERFA